jgi:hypothetical protein
MTRSCLLVIAMLATVQSAGCATISQGSTQDLAIAPYPGESQIKVTSASGETVYEGKAPATVKLNRNTNYKVSVEKPGYTPETIVVDSSFQMKWMVLDLFFTMGIGIPIDLVKGAANTLDDSGENTVEVTLFRPGTKPTQIED